jgi:hypothetical protein
MHVCSIFLYDGTKNSLFITDKEDKKIVNALVVFEVLQNHSLALTLKKNFLTM